MKTLSNKENSRPLESKKNTLVMRLERNLKDVHQLRSKLSSYNYEPQTHSLFVRIESLKSGLETLNKTNNEIIKSIKEHKKSANDYLETVKEQYLELNRLQEGVNEYRSLTQNKYV